MKSLSDVLTDATVLRCGICTQIYTDPRILPCLHTVCHQCLLKQTDRATRSAPEDLGKDRSGQESDGKDHTGQEDCGKACTAQEDHGKACTAQEDHGKACTALEDCGKAGDRHVCPICDEQGISGKMYSRDELDNMTTNHFMAHLCELYRCRSPDRPCDYCQYDSATVPATHLCTDCTDSLCDSCTDAHRRTKVTRGHTVVPYSAVVSGNHDDALRAAQGIVCPTHAAETVKYVCTQCDALVCRECRVSGHDGHACVELTAAAVAFTKAARSQADRVKQKFPNIEAQLEFLSDYGRLLEGRRRELTALVERQAVALHAVVDGYRDKVIGEISARVQDEAGVVADRQLRARSVYGILRSTAAYVDVLLAYGRPDEALSSRRLVTACLGELSGKNVEPMTRKLTMDFDAGHVSSETMEAVFGKVTCANVSLNNNKSPAKERPQPTETEKPQSGSPKLKHKKPAKPKGAVAKGTAALQASYIQLHNALQLNTNPTRYTDSLNMKAVRYTDTDSLSSDTGSLVTIPTKQPIDSLLTIGQTVTLLHTFECSSVTDTKDMWPTGLTVTPDDRIVVMDRENKTVKVYEPTGRFVREFGRSDLGCAYDVAVMKNGNVAATDYDQEDVKIFTPDGMLTAKLKGPMKYPRGIAIDGDGNLVIVDAHSHRVIVHEPNNGKVLRVIDGRVAMETGGDVLAEPYYVTVSPDGKIIVTDWISPGVKIFSSDGRYVGKLNAYAAGMDQSLQPYGVCTDRHGNIYLADNQNHRIHLLAPDGRFVKFVVSKQHGLWHPMAVAINSQGHLVVSEALGKIKTFKLN